MSDTKIEWTDRTWNPVRGCSRVSPECDNCYAMGQAHRFSGPGKAYEGLTVIRNGEVDWAGHARFVPEMLGEPLTWREPRKVFVNSMSDPFHHSVTDDQIAAMFGVMAACQHHTFQLLTKRADRAREWYEDFDGDYMRAAGLADEFLRVSSSVGKEAAKLAGKLYGHFDDELGESELPWPLPNVWLGTSCGNQKAADERIADILQCPAAVHFISAEPLLGPLQLYALSDGSWYDREGANRYNALTGTAWWSPEGDHGLAGGPKLDWVIVGGESGRGARPCEVAWIESVIEQCRSYNVPCFVKQLGSRPVVAGAEDLIPSGWSPAVREELHAADGQDREIKLEHSKGGDPREWPFRLRVRQFPEVRP